jgi:hypothetical protein
MKHFLNAVVFLFYGIIGYAQGHENTVLFGYEGGNASPTNDEFGINILTFTDGSLNITDNQSAEAFFNDACAAISDSIGHLLFYSNGIDIYDKSHQVMQNGGLINEFNATGFDPPQSAIIIPWPMRPDKYILFHLDEEWFEYPDGWVLGGGTGCFYSVVDMSLNNGLGKVIQKKQPIVTDTVEYGKLAMVRHANGRDWWLIVPELRSNRFYTVLVDPYGIHDIGIQTAGAKREYPGIGQATFSPDGTKYVMQNSIGQWVGYYTDIYDFDRCSGMLGNHEQMHFVDTFAWGIAISPNSRWMYLSAEDKIVQYDLWADSVALSAKLIGVYEPFNDPFPTKFFWTFLAPDNKIYIVTTSGSHTLHVIHRPDEAGTACAFEQRGVRLPCYNANSLPTFANYRLGPLDGSACDTLGIDNDPVSWWRYTQDTTNALAVEFTDLSYHEPAVWSWDFGDGITSNERHPFHIYDSAKVYQVCLTVSNSFDSDTHCKTLYLGVSAQDNPVLQSQITVSPNPFNNRVSVALSANLRNPVFRLYDATGRLVHEQQVVHGINEVETIALNNGMYFWQVVDNGESIKAGRMVKIGK